MRESKQPIIDQHSNTPIMTYYFTDYCCTDFTAEGEEFFYAIKTPLSSHDLYCLCGYLQLIRHNLPRLSIFNDFLTTCEIVKIIEEFYGYTHEIMYKENRKEVEKATEISLDYCWRFYAGFGSGSRKAEIEEIKRFTVENPYYRTLNTMFTIYLEDEALTPEVSPIKEHVVRPFWQEVKEKESVETKAYLNDGVIHQEWKWANMMNTSINNFPKQLQEFPSDA